MSINRSSDTFSRRVRSTYNQNSMEKGIKIPAGIYIGIVVDTVDPRQMGRVKVQIIKFYGTIKVGEEVSNPNDYLGAMWCRHMMPFGGTSSPTEGPNGVVSQTSFGVSGPPPGLNNEVVVAFSGDTHSGIVLGVLLDDGKNTGINGAGVTAPTASGKTTIAQEVSKTAESPNELADEHPQAAALAEQGLEEDRIRGQSTSSPTRDPTPRTMGLTSPSGHAITLDDGSLEDADSLLIRMRTAGGAQILMDDTLGLTYIINRNGSAWIELNRNGDIDIYSAKSINMATQGDFNINCGGNFNVNTGRNIYMQANGAEGVKLAAVGGSVDIFAEANLNLQAEANGNLRVAGNYRETAGRIDMNGPPASAATKPTVNQLAGNTNVTESVATRVPEAEPWAGHLDVSVLDTTSPSGAAAESNSYYNGVPVNTGTDGQAGDFPVAPSNPGDLLLYRTTVDRHIDPALLAMVTEVARQFGQPLTVTSGYRSPSHNVRVTGAKASQHMIGHAVDISGSGFTNQERLDLIAIASKVGIIGIGVYNDSSLHFDNRDGARAGWGSDFTRSSVPSYAVSTMNTHRSGGFA